MDCLCHFSSLTGKHRLIFPSPKDFQKNISQGSGDNLNHSSCWPQRISSRQVGSQGEKADWQSLIPYYSHVQAVQKFMCALGFILHPWSSPVTQTLSLAMGILLSLLHARWVFLGYWSFYIFEMLSSKFEFHPQGLQQIWFCGSLIALLWLSQWLGKEGRGLGDLHLFLQSC